MNKKGTIFTTRNIVIGVIVVAVIGVVAVSVYLYKRYNQPKTTGGTIVKPPLIENFKVLGALGPYKDLYYKCSSDCEKSDPRKQLLPTNGNWNCLAYCDAIITDASRRSQASFPRDYEVQPPFVETTTDKAYRMCGDGTKGDRCREETHTDIEVEQRCNQDCEYSTDPTQRCLEQCKLSYTGNYSMGWIWK